MRVVRSVAAMREARRGFASPVGFVPTMGTLHRGHFALAAAAREQCATVVASIFVNPLQFGPDEDFARYPRAFDDDIAGLRRAGVDAVFAPEAAQFVPPGLTTVVDPGPIATLYEGAIRPGHFAGVATIVTKLLHAVQPDAVYFGDKDAQQVRVIATIVRDLNVAVRIETVTTVREDDGLALSSRNAYLSPEERRASPGLYRALRTIADDLQAGANDRDAILSAARASITPPLREAYLDIVDPVTFETMKHPRLPALAIGSIWIGTTRLLDNIAVNA